MSEHKDDDEISLKYSLYKGATIILIKEIHSIPQCNASTMPY